MKKIPSIEVPIVDVKDTYIRNLFEFLKNKRVIIFGVPGAFTPTCSEKHLPGFIDLSDQIKKKNIDDIFCLSVNDKFVMQSWLLSYAQGHKIKCIADGNAEITSYFNLLSDKKSNFMGMRSKRFAIIVNNNLISKSFIEESSNFEISSAKNILYELSRSENEQYRS